MTQATDLADATASKELLTLTAANVFATLMRFVLLRIWVFRIRSRDERTAVLALRTAGSVR